MNPEEAKLIIDSALDKAIQKGVYSLQDVVLIVQALAVFFPSEDIETTKK
jgi:hypothetical protein